MSYEVFTGDGTVVSSSQLTPLGFTAADEVPPMYGIILEVYPSDNPNNYSAQGTSDLRGHRHECTVLAAENFAIQPDVILDHVVIPPQKPSGIDNYEEDLPRGCSKMVDGSEYNDNFEKLDYAKLDGEWCIINFVGGNIDHPFIAAWWPHPSNRFDPATSNFKKDESTLAQVDSQKNKSRFLRRVNGSYVLVNKFGDIYVDTSEANSDVSIESGKLARKQVDKGGNLQVDIAAKAQLEFNFNEKEHQNTRIGAGSKSQITVNGETAESDAPVADVDLPHTDQPVAGNPKTRSNDRTFFRAREYELIVKSSKILVFADAKGGFQGDIEFICDRLTRIKAGETTTIDAPEVNVGSAEADEPLVLGNQWKSIMTQLIDAIKNIRVATAVGPSTSPLLNEAEFVTIQTSIDADTQLSDFVKTKKEHS